MILNRNRIEKVNQNIFLHYAYQPILKYIKIIVNRLFVKI